MIVALPATQIEPAFWRAFEASFVGGVDPVLERMGLSRAELEQAAREEGEIRRVEVDGQAAGYLWLELRERTLHLHALLLDEGFRGRGVGAVVLGLLEEEYRGRADEFEVGVQDGNLASSRLVEKTGFEQMGARSDLGFRVLRKRLGR
jgi:ribosomal protein S18 acetylase RimI-like enzyme